MVQSGIYRILNTINGKIYIGSSKDVNSRFAHHRSSLRKGGHHSPLLQRSWDKHGEDAFLFEIVELCSVEDLMVREQTWLDDTKCYLSDKGYNCAFLADRPRVVRWSDERKDKMRKLNLGKKMSPESREDSLFPSGEKTFPRNPFEIVNCAGL